jgi:DNA recombination protein RmuC
MDPIILFAIIAIGFVLLLLQWLKLADVSRKTADLRPILDTLHLLQSDRGLLDRMLRDESVHSRQEQAKDSQSLRSEIMSTLVAMGDSVAAKVNGFSQANEQRAEHLRSALELRMQTFGSESARRMDDLVKAQIGQTETLSGAMRMLESRVEQRHLQQQNAVDDRLAGIEAAVRDQAQQLRQESGASFANLGQSLLSMLTEMSQLEKTEIQSLRTAVDSRLSNIQAENEKKLEQMRQTVEEKLQGTLEARLGDSFRTVSERLEQVQLGLGEMRSLATGVGDLKRVLSNVKTRGTWAEVQLGAIIEQILTPDQIGRNIAVLPGGDRVDYAVKMPGASAGHPVWLPIDASFPIEEYLRLTEAADRADVEGLEMASHQLEENLRMCARNLGEKHLAPPHTTDFGILFLSTEGLYAEAMRRPGLADGLQRDYRIVIAGPSTLAALLNALQMGFRTLAIQQRSSEVWEVLSGVKDEFGKYAQVLAAVKKKLYQAQETIDHAETRTRAIQRTLNEVRQDGAGVLPAETEDTPAEHRDMLVSVFEDD